MWEILFKIGDYEIWRHPYDGGFVYKAIQQGKLIPREVTGYYKLSTVLSQIGH